MYFEDDGSLTYGFECITQPMSIPYFVDNQKLFDDAFKVLVDEGMRSDEAEHCGLHIHVGRDNISMSAIASISYLLTKFQNQFQKFGRRRGNEYCSFDLGCEGLVYYKPDTEIFHSERDEIGTLRQFKEHFNNVRNRNRYLALNLTNDSTIEFRFFKGTLNANTFKASIHLIYALVNIAKNFDEETISSLTFNDIVDYDSPLKEYAVAYWNKRKQLHPED